ncbi:MAG TPA: heavy metal-associated domain-containing protein [Catenuloplanes sp.]|jgi:copper chaperone CopZ
MCTSESGCGCATATMDTTSTTGTAGVPSTYTVAGMTCGGCANSVRNELASLAGVTDARIDVASGTVTIISDAPVDAGEVRAAVERAGYTVVG